MRFDWYAATIRQDPNSVLGTILDAFPAASQELSLPRYGYTDARTLRYSGDSALLMFRAPDGQPETHVSAGGIWSHELARLLRAHFPAHSLARADACLDIEGRPGFWDWIIPIAIDLAAKHGCKLDQAGDWITTPNVTGRTLYIGAPTSTAMVRIYEKGKQLRTKGLDPDACLDWVRIEVQVRPSSKAKATAWAMPPRQLFASSAVGAGLLSIIEGQDIPHTPLGYTRRPTAAISRRFANLARQHGRFLLALAESLPGGPDELVQLLRQQQDAPHRTDLLQAHCLPPAPAVATAPMSANGVAVLQDGTVSLVQMGADSGGTIA